MEEGGVSQLNGSLQRSETCFLLKYNAMGLKTESTLYSTKLKGLSVKDKTKQ